MGNTQPSWKESYQLIYPPSSLSSSSGFLSLERLNDGVIFQAKELFLSDQSLRLHYQQRFQIRQNNPLECVVPLQELFHNQSQNYCSDKQSYMLVFPKPTWTLAQEIQLRRHHHQHFSVEEIKLVINNVALALRSLKSIAEQHSDVSLENIWLKPEVLLLDPLMLPSLDIEVSIRNLNQRHEVRGYPSPQKLQSMYDVLSEFQIFSSDLFSLGLVGLQMCYLDIDIKCIYGANHDYASYENLKINQEQVNKFLSKINHPILQNYLQILTDKRPSIRKNIYPLLNQQTIDARLIRFQNDLVTLNHQLPMSDKTSEQSSKNLSIESKLQHQNNQNIGNSSQHGNRINQQSANFNNIYQNQQNVLPERKTQTKTWIGNDSLNYSSINQPLQMKTDRLLVNNNAHQSTPWMNPLSQFKYPSFQKEKLPSQQINSYKFQPLTWNSSSSSNHLSWNRPDTLISRQNQRNYVSTNFNMSTNSYATKNQLSQTTIPKTLPINSNLISFIEERNVKINDKQLIKKSNVVQTSNATIFQNEIKKNMAQKINNSVQLNSLKSSITKNQLEYTPEKDMVEKHFSTIKEVTEHENSNQTNDDFEDVIEEYEIGTKYEGQKRYGKRNGHGKLYYKEGSYYEGQWEDNSMHGYGKLYYPDGQLAYQGEWANDEFHGKGEVYNDTPEMVFGGEFDYTDFNKLKEEWIKYEGELSADAKEGVGRLTLSNGEIFQGEFHQDKIEGEGVFIRKNGNRIKGLWKNSALKKIY